MFAVYGGATERGIRERARLRAAQSTEAEVVRSIEDIRRERRERERDRKRNEMAEWIRQYDAKRAEAAAERAWKNVLAQYRIIDVRSASTPARQIIERVAAFHGFTAAHLLGSSRERAIIEARHDAIKAVADARPDLSTTQIGKAFNRDHTTIIHALAKRGGRSTQHKGA